MMNAWDRYCAALARHQAAPTPYTRSAVRLSHRAWVAQFCPDFAEPLLEQMDRILEAAQ